MIDHLQNHWLGLGHVLMALGALFFGTVVILSRKGTRRHRWLGRSYGIMMLAMNGSALFNYELSGRFGPFHWMVLASLATLVAGYLPALRKAPGWKYRHAYFMAGSYVGLLAATGAEVASRVPGWTFGPAVLISSILIIALGVWVMRRSIPTVIGR